ncbi:MAG TPA: trypsin-like peptidase domain-containing protein, partial [bacterium]|nr:trypsin-like peptidase domain-containing protein [bacterium]
MKKVLLAAALLAVLPAMAAGEDPLDRVNDSVWEGRRTAIVRAAERVGPAVVTVSVLRRELVEYYEPSRDFFNPFFRGLRRRHWQRVKGLGSGVILRPDGVMLTNYHVVKSAEDVRITLPDGREYPARYLGGEELYDLAVLQIITNGDPVPVAPISEGNDLMIG